MRPLPLAALLLAACASSTVDDATSKDDLTAQDFDETVKELTQLPYLPWGYTPDGCYARALYYSMVLATKNVPSNHIYVVARNGTALGGQWRWHVAPVVTKDGDPSHLYVLDPDFSQTKALTNVEWVAAQGFPDPTAASYPTLHVWPGNSYMKPDDPVHPLVNPASPNAADYKEPAIADMPAFTMNAISEACGTMHDYIDVEPNHSAAEKTVKHEALGAATKSLVATLVTKGKIDGTPTLDASCTRAIGASGNRLGLPANDPTRR